MECNSNRIHLNYLYYWFANALANIHRKTACKMSVILEYYDLLNHQASLEKLLLR